MTPKPSEVKALAATQHKNKNRSMEFPPRKEIDKCLWLESSLFSADKHRVYLKGVVPDYIHATAVNVNTFIISTLCITDCV